MKAMVPKEKKYYKSILEMSLQCCETKDLKRQCEC